MTFTFGIYPGAALGGETGLIEAIRPDGPQQINEALSKLQGDAGTLLVRAYRPFGDPDMPHNPADPVQYAINGRTLDLVLTFRDPRGNVEGWLDFIRDTVHTDGTHLTRIQIAEEPNAHLPILDGSTPNVLEAWISSPTCSARSRPDNWPPQSASSLTAFAATA